MRYSELSPLYEYSDGSFRYVSLLSVFSVFMIASEFCALL